MVAYLILGFFLGAVFGYFLFFTNQHAIFSFIVAILFERLLFGAQILGNHYTLWFAINNSFALILAIVGGILLLVSIGRRRRRFSNRFASFEKYHPKITLSSLYMIPIGATIINSFLISLLLAFIYFTEGYSKLVLGIISILPNGITEIFALLLATSLGLSYVKIMEPFILKKKWREAINVGKKMVFSRTSLYVFIFVIFLILFSAYLEGRDLSLLLG